VRKYGSTIYFRSLLAHPKGAPAFNCVLDAVMVRSPFSGFSQGEFVAYCQTQSARQMSIRRIIVETANIKRPL
jgi:hypothetical protein